MTTVLVKQGDAQCLVCISPFFSSFNLHGCWDRNNWKWWPAWLILGTQVMWPAKHAPGMSTHMWLCLPINLQSSLDDWQSTLATWFLFTLDFSSGPPISNQKSSIGYLAHGSNGSLVCSQRTFFGQLKTLEQVTTFLYLNGVHCIHSWLISLRTQDQSEYNIEAR